MSESTQTQNGKRRVEKFLKNLDSVEELYEQVIVSEVVDDEIKRRKQLWRRANNIVEEYEKMSEEERGEMEEKQNKDGRYNMDQYKEIADKDPAELIPEDKLDELDIPARYVGGDVEARNVGEIREIMATLMQEYDPVLKEAPNWSESKRVLKEEHEIEISVPKLRRYWTAIEEKEAFNIVKQSMYWDIFEKLEGATEQLIDHVVDRVGTEGGDYDKITERVDALVKVVDMLKNLPHNEPDKVQVDKREAKKTTNEYVFKDMNEEEIEDIEEHGTIDVEEGE